MMDSAKRHIEAALSHEGCLLAAWDTLADNFDARLAVFVVEARLVQVFDGSIAAQDRPAVAEQLRQRPSVRIGAFDPRTGYVWCADEAGFALWSSRELVVEAARGEVRVRSTTILRTDQISCVVSFVDDSMVHRGVRLDLMDGSSAVLAEDRHPAPLADPTYGADNLSIDAAWARRVGDAISSWLGRPHYTDVP